MMRKSAKIFGVVLAAATMFSSLAMTACTTPDTEEPEHVHTFSETSWDHNDSQHWRPATCEHTDQKGSTANHDGKGANGACSVCGFVPTPVEHVHTYFEDWDFDEEFHWHGASCDHYDLISDKAEHDTNGEGGACSVCTYKPHEHTYNTAEWSKNALAHWHAATCGEGHELRFAADSEFHDYDESLVCQTCGYQHTHPVAKYKAVDETGHWDIYECIHQDITNKVNFEAHNTDGANGACTVCGWTEIVPEVVKDEAGNVTNWHTHTYKWEWNMDSHWKKIVCGAKERGNKSCDKGYYAGTPKNYDMGSHTYGSNGACTVCGFTNTWRYNTDECIKCDDCDGCVRTVCPHENEPDHKKCGDDRGADAKTVTLEAEEGEVWSREEGKTASIADYTLGKRECIHASYANVGWTIEVSKATKVTVKIHCGKTYDMFSGQGSILVNGVAVPTNTPCAQPKLEDDKCDPAWLTFGCIELQEGTNRIEVRQVGENGFHLDKIVLITDADVEIDFEPINNTWLYEIGQYVAIPKAEITA